jgi:hypothetical protein
MCAIFIRQKRVTFTSGVDNHSPWQAEPETGTSELLSPIL